MKALLKFRPDLLASELEDRLLPVISNPGVMVLTTGGYVLLTPSLGGPAYLRALRGPFPDVPFVPTGGVTAANLPDWLAAGAVAVGAGSELCPSAAMKDGRWETIEQRSREFAAAYRHAMSPVAS